MSLGVACCHRQEVHIDLTIPDHGQDPLPVEVRAVGVHADRPPADQVVQVVLCLLPEGLAWLVPVGEFRGVNAKEPDTELRAVRGEGNERIAVADLLDLGNEGAEGGGVGGRQKQENNASDDGEYR